MHLGAFSIVFIAILGFISNQNPTNQDKISIQFLKLSCPLPLNSATANVSLNGSAIVVTNITRDSSSGDYHVTTFNCYDANEGFSPSAPSVSTTVYTTANNWFGITTGYLFYLSEIISDIVQKIIAMFTIMASFLTPVNFTILGYTLADLGAVATMAVITIYIFCYLMIAIMIYKVISPFTGVG